MNVAGMKDEVDAVKGSCHLGRQLLRDGGDVRIRYQADSHWRKTSERDFSAPSSAGPPLETFPLSTQQRGHAPS